MSNPLYDTTAWFMEAKPAPTDRDRQVQLGVHFEEVAEMLAELKGSDRTTQAMLTQAMISLHSVALHLKMGAGLVQVIDDPKLLDALCDQIVTAVGVAHDHGYDIHGAMEEVNASNWSKFVQGKPVFDANGKIAKGPNYRKANVFRFSNPTRNAP